MTSNQEISGIPVISIETGQRLGTVDQIVLEPDGRTIAAFTVQSVTGGGMLSPEQPTASWLLADDIHAIGPDAVTVNNPDRLRETIDRKDYLLVGDLIRRKVVTEGGALIGDVAAVNFDQQSREVTGFDISGGLFKANPTIDIQHLVNIGSDLIIVDDSTSAEQTAAAGDTTTTPASDADRNVVGDVSTSDEPGSYQVVRKALDGEPTTQR